MKRGIGWLLPVAALFAATAARAQTGACPAPRDSTAVRVDSLSLPALRIEAQVTASELRIDQAGASGVTFHPCVPGSVVRVDRTNLPDHLQPGVTYRNVGVHLLIQTDYQVACRLASALGIPADTTTSGKALAKACTPAAPREPAPGGAPGGARDPGSAP